LSGGPTAASASDECPEPDRSQDYQDEKTGQSNRRGNAARPKGIDRGGTERVGDRAAERVEHGRTDALAGEVEEEQERVEPDGHPYCAERDRKGKYRCSGETDETGWPRRRKPSFGGVESRDVPWLEHLNLRHHAVSEERRWRKMGEPLERAHHLPRFGQLGATLRAILDVRN
jgi:hypothetical protein